MNTTAMITFATHFHNFYHEAPPEEVARYVEDLALWGFNTISVWYDQHHFEGFDDPRAVAFRERLEANGGVPNAACNEAFAELIEIYHAQDADPVVRPPRPRPSGGNR